MDSSALTTLVAAATEGMRKTQSAEEMQGGSSAAAMQPSTQAEGHQSDSAMAPTRERKKGTFFFFLRYVRAGNLPFFFLVFLRTFFSVKKCRRNRTRKKKPRAPHTPAVPFS